MQHGSCEVYGRQFAGRMRRLTCNDVFARVDYKPEYELQAQVEMTGHKLSDIKMVIMGHLHLDHAGGLSKFFNTDVPVLVHELELKNAFYSVATKHDLGKLAVNL